jgi:hypothetical protein
LAAVASLAGGAPATKVDATLNATKATPAAAARRCQAGEPSADAGAPTDGAVVVMVVIAQVLLLT